MNKIRYAFGLILAVCISQGAGIIGSLFTMSSIPTWYAGLAKPLLAPPNWIFAPVWITLYTLMGIAAFLVWKEGFARRDVKIALFVFGGQLVLNALWSILFFGLQSPGWAFAEIVVLWIFIAYTIKLFTSITKISAWLLVPYLVWVSFAGYLNYAIWMLNS